MIGIDFAVNAILSPEKRIIKVLAGDPLAIMQRGIPEARRDFSSSGGSAIRSDDRVSRVDIPRTSISISRKKVWRMPHR